MKKLSLNVMSFLYFSAGLNHLLNPEIYQKIMPPFFPAPGFLIGLSGVIEMLFGILLLKSALRALSAWGIILMLIAFLPVHFYMYHVGGAVFGVPDWTLFMRVPLQFLLIAWAFQYTRNPEIDTRIIQTRITLKATPDQIWKVLTDFPKYQEWNPLIISASGKGDLGEKMQIKVRLPDAQGKPRPDSIKFENVIVEYDPKKLLAWKGRFLWRGLFEGYHTLKINRISNEETEVLNEERFSGAFIPLLTSSLKQIELGFYQMNEALKTRCEI